jgi:TatD DNase family protein
MHLLVDIHTHGPDTSPESLRLVCVDPDAMAPPPAPHLDRFCSGIHPWDWAHPEIERRFGMIASAAASGRISAIGETGLDRSCHASALPIQLEWFRRHIALSEETRLPLVIHSVRTDSDILAEHALAKPRSPWILHACAAGTEGLGQILSKRIRVSFGPREMSHPDTSSRLAAAYGPLFFLETDDSKTPLSEVYAQASRLLGLAIEEIAKTTLANWRSLFHN